MELEVVTNGSTRAEKGDGVYKTIPSLPPNVAPVSVRDPFGEDEDIYIEGSSQMNLAACLRQSLRPKQSQARKLAATAAAAAN